MKALISSAILVLRMAQKALKRAWLSSGTSTVKRLVGPEAGEACWLTHLSASGNTTFGRAFMATFLLIVPHKFGHKSIDLARSKAVLVDVGDSFTCGESLGENDAL